MAADTQEFFSDIGALNGGKSVVTGVDLLYDPEFQVYPGRTDPGTPIGTIPASQISEVQSILNEYVLSQHFKTKKILIAHQFGDPAVHDGVPNMLCDKESLTRFPNLEIVIDADGLGSPLVKVHKYNLLTSSRIAPSFGFEDSKFSSAALSNSAAIMTNRPDDERSLRSRTGSPWHTYERTAERGHHRVERSTC
jgi:hypothetical protein